MFFVTFLDEPTRTLRNAELIQGYNTLQEAQLVAELFVQNRQRMLGNNNGARPVIILETRETYAAPIPTVWDTARETLDNDRWFNWQEEEQRLAEVDMQFDPEVGGHRLDGEPLVDDDWEETTQPGEIV